ncbi:MAG: 4-alpha-glucanotransferase, partial [Actinomycetota bacterium]
MRGRPSFRTPGRRARLLRRAESWGVADGYDDHRGRRVDAPPETVARVLEVLGARSADPPSADTVVARLDDPPDLSGFRVLELEGGGEERLDGSLPPDVPAGYHVLIDADGNRRRLILSPGRCFLPEDLSAWGWAAQLYAVRSEASWGIGDLGDLERLGRWSAELGAQALLVNPLHAVLPGTGQQASPYFPSSRCFRNLLYLRIEDIPGASDVESIADLARDGRALDDTRLIERDRIYELKLRALEDLWRAFRGDGGFDRYVASEGRRLRDYATFAALAERHGGGPSAWPAELGHPAASGVARWRADNEHRVAFHSWVQWLLHEQMERAASAVGVINDLAIGVDPDGADAWVWQDAFATGVQVG